MELKTEYYRNIYALFKVHTESTKSVKRSNPYTGNAKQFFQYLEENGISTLKAVNADVMKSYFNYLVTRPKKRGTGTLSIRTVNDHLSTLWLLSNRLIDGNEGVLSKPLAIPKFIKETDDEGDELEHSLPFKLKRHILTVDEIKQVYNACQTNLERALIALAYGCGMRCGSIESLEERHIDFVQGTIVSESDKFNKTRTIPVSDFFLKVLKDYTHERLDLLLSFGKNESRFLINEKGLWLNDSRMNDLLKAVIARTGNQQIVDKCITLHCLRHSIASHLMDSGQSFEYVRRFLGHAFIDTTTIYAKRRKIKDYYSI